MIKELNKLYNILNKCTSKCTSNLMRGKQMKTRHEVYDILKCCIIEKGKEELKSIPTNDENYIKQHDNKLFKLDVEIELLERILEVD